MEDSKVIRENLIINLYPEKLLDAIITNFISKQSSQRHETPVLTVPKKEIMLSLPCLGQNSSEKLRKGLKSLFSQGYPQVNISFVFRTTQRIANLFRYKDTIPKRLKSFIVYGVHCTDCNASYAGKTKRHLITQ